MEPWPPREFVQKYGQRTPELQKCLPLCRICCCRTPCLSHLGFSGWSIQFNCNGIVPLSCPQNPFRRQMKVQVMSWFSFWS
ncbi:hypothetical protein BOO71_0002215 [Deinococcus marmoris]|uniref:Uncharacterized protein n=1 Tax=Deinococcus marmoris TaxID=249408 RepID=A0A1U7P378_9DEIO|nr:hypothetical protein BOO71_0002215 [Deinococcus marmoris]